MLAALHRSGSCRRQLRGFCTFCHHAQKALQAPPSLLTGPYASCRYAAQYAQPPAYAQAAPAYYGHPDEVRTVFITGFPDDIKERELNNLLRFLPGYEVS